jgi:hypothetical protein
MSAFTYENTLEPADALIHHLPWWVRIGLAKSCFVITEALLIAGAVVDPVYWQWVVWFSIVHALLFAAILGFKPLVFPTQLRIVYVAWVAVGTFVPYMSWMMYVTLVGLAASILVGWCPLSRMIYLLAWNRQRNLTPKVVFRTFFSMPRPGRFKVAEQNDC